MANRPHEIELLSPARASDGALVGALTDLVNRVYAEAEEGLWIDGASRTSTTEMAKLIADGEIAVATVDDHKDLAPSPGSPG